MARRVTDIAKFADMVDRMIDRFFDHWADRWFEELTPTLGFEHTPPLDLIEAEDSYIVRVEVPGVKKEELDVAIQGKRLTIQGKKEYEKREEQKGFLRMECYHGEFKRSIILPGEVDTENVTATYKDGVLEIRLPKIEKEKGKRIEVKVA